MSRYQSPLTREEMRQEAGVGSGQHKGPQGAGKAALAQARDRLTNAPDTGPWFEEPRNQAFHRGLIHKQAEARRIVSENHRSGQMLDAASKVRQDYPRP